MKVNQKLICTSIISMGFVLLTACVYSPLTDVTEVDLSINLLVTGNGSNADMRVSTGPMQRCFNSNDGCMVFELDEEGKIAFDMSANDGDFYLTQLQICKGDVKPPVGDCVLTVDGAFNFYVELADNSYYIPNPNTGKISWPVSKKLKTFVLHNLNKSQQNYYYLVTACDEGLHCPVADPVIENKAKN